MKTYMQLSTDGTKGHYKFEAESKPEWHPSIILIDITNMDPEPQEGWLWDGKVFSAPPPQAPQPPDRLAILEGEINALKGELATAKIRLDAAERKVSTLEKATVK